MGDIFVAPEHKLHSCSCAADATMNARARADRGPRECKQFLKMTPARDPKQVVVKVAVVAHAHFAQA